MTLPSYPFTPRYDSAGHNVVGIEFDQPIPWPLFDGGGASESCIAERIGEALDAPDGAPIDYKGYLSDLRGAIEAAQESEVSEAQQASSDLTTALHKLNGARVIADEYLHGARVGKDTSAHATERAVEVLSDEETRSGLVEAIASGKALQAHLNNLSRRLEQALNETSPA